MTKQRNVKTARAALAAPASAGSRLPDAPETHRPLDMADALENQVSGLGTSRDKRSFSEYGFIRPLQENELRAMWRGSWLAGAIVSTPAEDMVRGWFRPDWEGIDKKDAAAVKRSEARFGIKQKVRIALTWARLFGGGVIVIGIRGEDLSTPLNLKTIRRDSLQNLHVRDRYWVYPVGQVDQDESSPNYGMPLFYRVRSSSVTVHWSRVVRFDGHLVPYDDWLANNYWHDSELQHVLNSIKDYDGAKDNVASMMWEAKIDVIKTALAKLTAMKDGGAAVNRRYADAVVGKSNHRLLLINNDEEYTSETLAFGGVHDILGDFVTDVCGAARIPMVKLFGQSAPGMNSTGDMDTRLYYDRVLSEEEWQMIPACSYLYEVVIRDALGRMPEGVELIPNPLWQVSAKDQADIELKQAQRDQIYLQEGVATPGLVARELKARGTYRTIEEEDVTMAKELDQPIEQTPGNEPTPAPAKKGQKPGEQAAT